MTLWVALVALFSMTEPHGLSKVQDERLRPPLFLPSKQALLFRPFSDLEFVIKLQGQLFSVTDSIAMSESLVRSDIALLLKGLELREKE